MPGTLKIWWHDGSTRDARYHPTPLINEPALGFETVSVGTSPSASSAAPPEAHVAVIESNVAIRYVVEAPGSTLDADDPSAKPMAATGFGTATIGVQPGHRISVREDTV
ncbi:MAG: hypothetical protein AAF568_08475 [Pseudomonadota bacterium]